MWTHGIGTLMAVVALVLMVLAAGGEPVATVSAAIFGTTLVLLYGASTLYHWARGPKLKSFLQVLDHACIYLLIAGSYTPLTLVALRGPWGWSLFGVIWFLAIAGVVLKACIRSNREAWWSTALYLVMGWMIVLALKPLLDAIPLAAFVWLVAGGLCYSLGVGFFVWQRLRFNHAIWHAFVIAGSACHVVATLLYIIP